MKKRLQKQLESKFKDQLAEKQEKIDEKQEKIDALKKELHHNRHKDHYLDAISDVRETLRKMQCDGPLTSDCRACDYKSKCWLDDNHLNRYIVTSDTSAYLTYARHPIILEDLYFHDLPHIAHRVYHYMLRHVRSVDPTDKHYGMFIQTNQQIITMTGLSIYQIIRAKRMLLNRKLINRKVLKYSTNVWVSHIFLTVFDFQKKIDRILK